MGEFRGGLVHRTSKYFNNPEFSDVEFVISERGEEPTIIHAHKLILCMASAEFATFFREHPQSCQIKVNASEFSPKIVNHVLLYLYSDDLFIKDIEEAVDIFKLAEKFGISELKAKCRKYITLDNPTLENVLTVYEIALKENVVSVNKCREFVSQQTAEVLALPRFLEVSVNVVKDILNLNCLSMKESELLKAVMLWVKRDCKKRGRPTEKVCLRDSISPLLPFIRILALSIEEFYDFVEEHDIFTTPESIKLTRKILEPEADCSIPPGFCSISVPRSGSTQIIPNGFRKPKVPENSSISKNNDTRSVSIYKNTVNPVKNLLSPSIGPTEKAPLTQHQNGVWDDNLDAPEKPLFQFAASTVPPPVKRQPMLKVMNNQMTNSKKIYDFPLQAMKLGLNAVSKSDLICSAELQVRTGIIVVLGVELKVLNSSQGPEESIKVFTQISGDSFPETNIDKQYKLFNNMIQVIFPDPLRIKSGQTPVKIEITIEDLKLNRCNVCRESSCEINSGLNLATMVKLKSNQPNQGEGFFYFISRLIYS